MIVAACVDDNYGTMFNNRRQSRDRTAFARFLEIADGAKIFMTPYSQPLFEENDANIVVCEDPLEEAGTGDYCFIEGIDPYPYINNIESVILIRWNRLYPADRRFDRRVLEGMKLSVSEEFEGSSHENITIETYIKDYKE